MSDAELDRHLAGCAGCVGWLEDATRAGRLLRVSGDVPPDLSAAILDRVVLPGARAARRRGRLRLGLALVAIVQWALALPALLGEAGFGAGMAMGVHTAHESAAWNLAVGAAFVAVAVRPARASGALPILTTFVVVLAVLSVPDLFAGQVSDSRLAGHAAVIAGLVLITLLSRSEPAGPPARQSAGSGSGLTLRPGRSRGAA